MNEDIITLQDDQATLQEAVLSLQKEVKDMKHIINFFVFPDRYMFERPLVGGASGLRILTSASQKTSLYGLTPIVQPSTFGETIGVSDPTVQYTTTITGNVGSTAYTVSDVVKHMKNIGLLLK